LSRCVPDARGITNYPSLPEFPIPSPQGYPWSPIALRLLENAPDRVEVLKRFVLQIKSAGGWGSRAAIVQANAKLLDRLEQYPDPAVTALMAEEKVRLDQYIKRERRSEAASDRKRSDRFE